MCAGFAGSVVAGLVVTTLERAYDAGREKLERASRQADFSEDLDQLETEFQRALHDRVSEEVEGPRSNALVDVVEQWDPLVHELYSLEEAAETPEAVEAGDHDRLLFQSDEAAIEALVTAWGRAADVGLDGGSMLKSTLRKAVAEAYADAFETFADEIAGTDLADVFEIETLREIQQDLRDLARESTAPKVYKTLEEFAERLISQQEYVPVAAERESASESIGFGRRDEGVESTRVEDARAEALDLLDSGADVVCVYGEGGAGKSQLLASIGRVLQDRGDRDVRYVTDTHDLRPPDLDRDTVLFVDDAGRKDMDYFIRLASESERVAANEEYTVQVVTAARSVYEETVDEVVNELPRISAPTLRLEELGDEQAHQLLGRFDVGDETADDLIEMAQGNPFFLVLLGQLVGEADDDEVTIEDMRGALEKVVGRMVRTDIETVGESTEHVRRFLDVLAVWQTYDEPEDADVLEAITPSFANKFDRRERLRALADDQYLDWQGDGPRNATYSLRHDVVTDYLRFEMLGEGGKYQGYAEEALDSRAPAIAEGLLDLTGSPLLRFYRGRIEQIRDQFEWLAEVVFERDLSVPTIFETEANIALASLELVPSERLHELFEEYEQPDELLEPVVGLAEVTSNRAREDEEWLTAFGNWLDRLAEIHAQTGAGLETLAKALMNAVTSYGEAERFEGMEERIAEMRGLHADYEEESVREPLAEALYNAVTFYGEAERFEGMGERLEELERLHEKWGDEAVRTALSKALMNAVHDYGEVERFEGMEERIGELRDLHGEYEEKYVRTELAAALMNAVAGYGEAERFEEMEERIGELRDLHADYEEEPVWTELAKALTNAVVFCGEAKRFDEIEERIGELRDLHGEYEEEPVRESLAKALMKAVTSYGEAERFEGMEERIGELEDLHAEYEEEQVRELLAKALLTASSHYRNSQKLSSVESVLDQLDALATEHGDFGGITDDEAFFQTERDRVLFFLDADEALAHRLLDVLEQVCDDAQWTRLGNRVLPELDQRFADGDLSAESYQRFADRLT